MTSSKFPGWLLATALVAVLAFAYFVWPGPYRYERLGEYLVRIDRLSGDADILRGEGWEPMAPKLPEGAALR